MAGSSLLGWLDRPSAQRGLHIAEDADDWRTWTYEELAQESMTVARHLVRRGVGQGSVVMIMQPAGFEFAAAFFGALLAGAVPSPLAPPEHQDSASYKGYVLGVLATASPAIVIGAEAAGDTLGAIVGDVLALPFQSYESLDRDVAVSTPPARRDPGDLALLQFTSGSSGLAKGVRVSFAALEANISAISSWLGLEADDVIASWLPVHHDMGLVGCLLTPISHQLDIWMMRPRQFLRRPERFIRCFTEFGATRTAMPTFGMEYLARRVRAPSQRGLALRGVRSVVLGTERIRPAGLATTADALGCMGLDPEVLLPAYGLAEATLAVAGVRPGETKVGIELTPDRRHLASGPTVLTDLGPDCVVGCGPTLQGVGVTIVDDEGMAVPDGCAGEIVVEGASVADGYWGSVNPLSRTRFSSGALHTGDVGVLVDGSLYVVGRAGDSIKVTGRTVFAEDLEASLLAEGLGVRSATVALGWEGDEPVVLTVLEGAGQAWIEGVEFALQRRVPEARILIRSASHGSIPRTSSGKPRRRMLWDGYISGLSPLDESQPERRGGPR